MIPRILLCLFLLVSFSCCLPAAQGHTAVLVSGKSPVAVRTFGVWDQESGERFDFAVYYPGGSSEAVLNREGRRIEVANGSRILPGFYPVILLSHDTAGSRFANGDLAAAMAAGGFVVIAPTHAGDNQNDSSLLYTARLVLNRPRQLLKALDTLLGIQEFSQHVDESRIGLLGVGFGSITVMQLAGARPDFSVLDEYCRPFEGQNHMASDPFCISWVKERLTLMPQEMAALEKSLGRMAFTPPLDSFAPKLEPAPALCELPLPQIPEEGRKKGASSEGRSFWRRIFSSLPQKDAEPEPSAATIPAEAAPPLVNATAPWDPLHDFQELPFFSKSEASEVFVPRMEAMLRRPAVSYEAIAAPPPPPVARPSAPPVYRRPASVRRIGAIGLVLPAGGMLFSLESLQRIHLPVALVAAEEDGLYTLGKHAQPYADLMHGQCLMLRLPGVDHFSLYAPCNKELAVNLGDVCGRLVGDDREKAAKSRDTFLLSFFQSVLGRPKEPPEPSGLVAVKINGEKEKPSGGTARGKEDKQQASATQRTVDQSGREQQSPTSRRPSERDRRPAR